MYHRYEQRLRKLVEVNQRTLLADSRIGLEKETLRVSADGHIAQTPHPRVLGSALTHPYITTDYSEALLELITPPFTDIGDALGFLGDVHQFVYGKMEDEMLWATSMPCVMDGEKNILIARYGTSNPGLMKHVYRRGLGYRYGRTMQVIAGVHFNYSLPTGFWPVFQDIEADRTPPRDFISASYFCLIRNLQRFGWMIPYLFGASPAVCKSFLGGRPTPLAEFDANTYFGPYATSLRLSDIGYTNSREKKTGLNISYNSLDQYVTSLIRAIETPCPEYQRIGVVVDGEYRQLNANSLQIENEYYSTMRPKQIPIGDEKPSLALKRRGVQYVELRSLDVSAFDPLGINPEQARFLEAFLVFCLLHESPPISARERTEIDHNLMATATRGREPGLQLQHGGRSRPLQAWAAELCELMGGVSELLDAGRADRAYRRALEGQSEIVHDPERTPSARVLAEMREHAESFFHFAKRMSQAHQRFFQSLPVNEGLMERFRTEAAESLQRQQAMEAEDTIPFEKYLRRYFTQS